MEEVDKYHKAGTQVPQLEHRVTELKNLIRNIMDEEEVDPRNIWTIKAHELLV